MADQRRVRPIRLAFIQQGFQPPRWSIDEEGFDSIGHVTFLSQHSDSVQQSAKTNSNRKGREGRKEKEWLCSLVSLVPWFLWFLGFSGSLVSLVLWFLWFLGFSGSLFLWFLCFFGSFALFASFAIRFLLNADC